MRESPIRKHQKWVPRQTRLVTGSLEFIIFSYSYFWWLELIEDESSRCQNLVQDHYFHQEFEEANNLVERLAAKNCKATCSYDVSLVLQTIAHTEDHPAPEDIGDIDLKYLFIRECFNKKRLINLIADNCMERWPICQWGIPRRNWIGNLAFFCNNVTKCVFILDWFCII